jgi:hypothetical protein
MELTNPISAAVHSNGSRLAAGFPLGSARSRVYDVSALSVARICDPLLELVHSVRKAAKTAVTFLPVSRWKIVKHLHKAVFPELLNELFLCCSLKAIHEIDFAEQHCGQLLYPFVLAGNASARFTSIFESFS